MPEHGHSGLEAGCRLDPAAECIAHSLFGQLKVTERIPLLRAGRHRHRRLERPHLHPLGHDDDAEVFALGAPPVQVCNDGIQLRLEFRNDDHVGAARQATDHRHPSGVPSHHLHHHDAVMGRRCGVQPVESLDHDSDRGIEADAELSDREIVVDRLRHAHHRVAAVAHRRRDR